jgi:phosphoribosyl 1,2-cyclic phosphate phosphodiesterase
VTETAAAMRVTCLGSGSSGGVPLINGEWGACDPSNPKNRRRRASVLVEEEGRRLLIDTSPDLRNQMLDAGVERLDAVLITHDHADHTHGLDDLRAFAFRQGPIPSYMDAKTAESLRSRFGYAFASKNGDQGLYRAMIDDREITLEPFEAAGFTVRPFLQDHGYGQTTLGFRIGDFAYSTDVVALDEAAFSLLEGTRVWFVDCLQEKPHPTHSHREQTFEWIERVKPEQAVLMHMNHSMDYDALNARCPDGVEPGYDGLSIAL